MLLLGLLALLMVDYIQLLIPQFYRLVINGVNLGQVVVNGQTLPFTKEVLLQHICLPMIWIVVLMVIGRFLCVSAFRLRCAGCCQPARADV